MQKPHALVLLLPDADRKMLDMAFFDHKTLAEIAEETGFPIDLVASRLHGAMSSLRSGLLTRQAHQRIPGLRCLTLTLTPSSRCGDYIRVT